MESWGHVVNAPGVIEYASEELIGDGYEAVETVYDDKLGGGISHQGLETDIMIGTLVLTGMPIDVAAFKQGFSATRAIAPAIAGELTNAAKKFFSSGGGAVDDVATSPTRQNSVGRIIDSRTGRYVNVSEAKASSTISTHGNVAGEQPAYLYELWDENGSFLKNGVHQDVSGYQRYSSTFMEGKTLRYTDYGPRQEMLQIERLKTEIFPGSLNLESWAGTKSGFLPEQWKNLQTLKQLV